MLLSSLISEDDFFKLPATRALTDSNAETGTSDMEASVLTVTEALIDSVREMEGSGIGIDI